MKISESGIYVSSRGDGVFYSGDWGKYWKSINNGMTSLYIFSMEIFNNNLFVGSDGVFKLTDNGENWLKSSNGLPEVISITGLFDSLLLYLD